MSAAQRFALGCVVTANAVALYMVKTDEGSSRSFQFWSGVFPMFLHYRGIQLLNRDLKIISDEKADKLYLNLHPQYSENTKKLTFQLRGFYLKAAQLMSMQDHFVPEEYMKWVKDTQDNVPSEFTGDGARRYVSEKMKEELNLEFDDVFSSWDDTPLGQ